MLLKLETNFLFNPTTKELSKLDYPVLKLNEGRDFSFIGLGFGYDLESDDYKLVSISCCKKLGDQYYSSIDLYSLGTNSWGRVMDSLLLGTVALHSISKALVNGALHWSGVTMKSGVIHYFVVSFDIRNEVTIAYRYIESPELKLTRMKKNGVLLIGMNHLLWFLLQEIIKVIKAWVVHISYG